MFLERRAHRAVGVFIVRDVGETRAAHFGKEAGPVLGDLHYWR